MALFLGTTTADAGLFSMFKKGGCHGDDCCPTCACPEECCEEPSCCAPEECCPEPSCCAPEECCPDECCPDECGASHCGKRKGLFSRLFSCLKKKRNHGCCEEDCCPVECCEEPACCAPACCAPECAAPGACN